MNTQLLCTFVNNRNIIKWLKNINEHYDFYNDKVYILDVGTRHEVVCSYSVYLDKNEYIEHVPNTIAVHRKKDTNTIYTINALNEIIKNMNNGILDHSMELNWKLYQNQILLTKDNQLKKINTKLREIVNI